MSGRKRPRDEGERRSKAQEVRHHQNVVHLNVAEHDASELEQSATAGLYLWRNGLTTEAAKRIAKSIPRSKGLKFIWIAHNKFGDEAMEEWLRGAQILDQNPTMSVTMSLASIQLMDCSLTAVGAEAFAKMFTDHRGTWMPHLTKLSLGYNRLGDAGVAALSALFPCAPALTDLNLYANQVGDRGAQEIGLKLEHSQLQSIELGANDIGENGLKALALGATMTTALTTLGLSMNVFVDKAKTEEQERLAATSTRDKVYSVKNLCEVLKDTKLRHLDLRHNHLGNRAAEELAKVLAGTEIETMDLRHNAFDIRAVESFIKWGIRGSKLQIGGLNMEHNATGSRPAYGSDAAGEAMNLFRLTKIEY